MIHLTNSSWVRSFKSRSDTVIFTRVIYKPLILMNSFYKPYKYPIKAMGLLIKCNYFNYRVVTKFTSLLKCFNTVSTSGWYLSTFHLLFRLLNLAITNVWWIRGFTRVNFYNKNKGSWFTVVWTGYPYLRDHEVTVVSTVASC